MLEETLAALSKEAIRAAADRLGADPVELARRLQGGLLAELVLEVKIASRLFTGARDRERALRLLHQMGFDRQQPT